MCGGFPVQLDPGRHKMDVFLDLAGSDRLLSRQVRRISCSGSERDTQTDRRRTNTEFREALHNRPLKGQKSNEVLFGTVEELGPKK